MPVVRRARVALGLGLAAVGLLPVGSCLDDAQIVNPAQVATIGSTAEPTASEPVTASFAAASRAAPGLPLRSLADGEVSYVSLPPGTVPDGGIATISNARLDVAVTTAMQDGGFDPVGIAAMAGDTLSIRVERAGGAVTSLRLGVPMSARPRVVRANPPPRKRDVPLNTNIVVVFTEPIRQGTETGIRLLRGGTPVAGRVTLSSDGLRAELQATSLLGPNAEHQLVIPGDLRDLTGEAMGQAVTSTFTTGTTHIVASVVTDPSALINAGGTEPRAFTMTAVLDNEGRVSGSFSYFYPSNGARGLGRVTCFAIVGNAAWIGGVMEGSPSPDRDGSQVGWRATDDPDRLSLVYGLAPDSMTAQDFCATTPPGIPGVGEIPLYDVVSGQIIVNESGPPPPPTTGMSEIAYAAYPVRGIQVVRADGTGARTLTSDSGDFSPAWSPDGSRLAFDRNHGDEFLGDIYTIYADGSGLRRLTSDESDDADPAWSPNGDRIAFGRDAAVYVINATDGSGVRALTGATCGPRQPPWSPDPSWSPDGMRIAFAGCTPGSFKSAIYVMNADGSAIRQITFDSVSNYAPAWSPDGRRIAFERTLCCPYGGIHTVSPDGTNLAQVTLDGEKPAWSADGSSIVFRSYGRMHVANADGTGVHVIGVGTDPAWSPVGSMPSRPPRAATVTLSPKPDTLMVGDTIAVTATARDAAGSTIPGLVGPWTTSDSAIVALYLPGYRSVNKLIAKAAGVATVVGTIDGKSDAVVVHVIPR